MEVGKDISRGSGCGSQLKLWLGFLMTDRGPVRKTTLHVSRGPSTQHSEEATTITFYNFFLISQFKTVG
ncbi:hypothetical protein F7725_000835 [Dissostichus mawsoni]|uniref:Uncharacterized protein n=1 Tax=Dissostichus mawsoni TaxID=36200 RepID=A0A7J5ZG19_DISMA|nr:hypothetical protein F7725_000835 [Dissostichus mawsoni]